jgi:hypothetical protein
VETRWITTAAKNILSLGINCQTIKATQTGDIQDKNWNII